MWGGGRARRLSALRATEESRRAWVPCVLVLPFCSCPRTGVAHDSAAVDNDSWRVESLQVKLHKDVSDRLGADRSMFHAGVVEIPTGMVQSVGDAAVLSVPIDELRHVLPREDASASPER